MDRCWKYDIKVTGCSKWSGGNTRKICHSCLSEYKSYPSENTPIKTQPTLIKTKYRMVKTLSRPS